MAGSEPCDASHYPRTLSVHSQPAGCRRMWLPSWQCPQKWGICPQPSVLLIRITYRFSHPFSNDPFLGRFWLPPDPLGSLYFSQGSPERSPLPRSPLGVEEMELHFEAASLHVATPWAGGGTVGSV